ncbi:MAG: cyclodeaminase/cyclohydrolase family protein [Clostridiales Family XIII bacterium]|jgi:formiminotetrahydrofolate cyclodeaminase|nr:cyclodeaminase/cyclohydrolase family protein [Clostridiales Family XIII bacterium]
MAYYTDISVKEFVLQLSGKQPAPGGGGASALVGALGIALGSMVANLTVGKAKYAEVEEELKTLTVRAGKLQTDLLELVEKDAIAFKPLAEAYRMASETEEERAEKSRVMESCLKDAALVPLEMMRCCGEAIELLEVYAEKGSTLALSDAACGAVLCRAALQSAWINVKVNTVHMKDRAFAEALNREGMELLNQYLVIAEAIYHKIEVDLDGEHGHDGKSS